MSGETPSQVDVTAAGSPPDHGREPDLLRSVVDSSPDWILALFEHAAIGFALLESATGRFLRVNRKYGEILGYTAEELCALDFMRVTHPDDLAEDLAAMAQLARGEIREFALEKRLLRKDGSIVWVALAVAAMWAVGEAPTVHVATVQDISARKAAEHKSRQSHAALESTLAALPDLLFDVDDEGRIYDFRAPRPELLAAPPEAFLGRRLQEIVPAEAATIILAALRDAVLHGVSAGARYALPIGGAERWFEISVARKQAEVEPPRLIAIARDVTERVVAEAHRRSLEAQLRQAQKMEAVGALAGGIAHDFNNLLTVIGLSVGSAQRALEPGHRAIESLREVDVVVARAEKLVQQILAFSRKQPVSRAIVSASDAVREATRFLRATLPAGIRLVVSAADAAPWVNADPTQLQQVLINLGTNAWQAIDRGRGTITFRVDQIAVGAGHQRLPAGDYARFRVSDDGAGMSPATLDRIFEPFFSTKGPGGGSGLGLSVVHGIVEDHGGFIVVESEPARGTTFDVYLGTVPATTTAKVEPQAPVRGRGARVVFVDDEPMMVDTVRRLLEHLGYRTQGFTNPREALDAIRQDPRALDLLLTDLNMPELSGLDLAREVSAIRADLPIVLVSGFAPQPDEQLAAVGIRRRLPKPFDVSVLSQVLRTLIG